MLFVRKKGALSKEVKLANQESLGRKISYY